MKERRKHTQEFKDMVVAEALVPGTVQKDILNKYELSGGVLRGWIQIAQEGQKPRKNAITPVFTPPTIKQDSGELQRLRKECSLLKQLLALYMKES